MKKAIIILACVSFLIAAPAVKSKVGTKAQPFMIKKLNTDNITFISMLNKIKENDGMVVLDFWATWCVPCKKELPIFEKIYKELEAKNIYFYAISIDAKRTPDLWQFVKKNNLTFNVLWDANAFHAAKKYGADKVLPQLFIIDKEGIIRAHHVGEIKNLEAVLKADIEKIKPGTFPKHKNVKAKMGKTATKKKK